MNYRELTTKEEYRKQIMDFVSFKTLKGYPCPFCRDKNVHLEKEDDKGFGFNTDIWVTDIRVLCKTCRRVENYIRVESNFRNNVIVKITNPRTCLQLSDDLYLDMNNEVFKVYNQRHTFKLEIPPFTINYLELDKLIDKIEIMGTFS